MWNTPTSHGLYITYTCPQIIITSVIIIIIFLCTYIDGTKFKEVQEKEKAHKDWQKQKFIEVCIQLYVSSPSKVAIAQQNSPDLPSIIDDILAKYCDVELYRTI